MDNLKIVTHVEINPANTPDVQTVVSGIDRLEQIGLKPEVLLAGNGYASDDNHQELKKRGVELVCPPSGHALDGFGVAEAIDFSLDEDGQKVDTCPADQSCLENRVNENRKSTSSSAVEISRSCPHSYDCPVKITKHKAKRTWNWKQPRLEARRLQFAEDPDMKKPFRQRSGGEGLPKTTFAH